MTAHCAAPTRAPYAHRVLPTDQTEAGKALAVWLYCIGARSLAATDRAFLTRPHWREA